MRRITRRDFVRNTALTGAALAAFKATLREAQAYAVSPRIRKFMTPIRQFGTYGPFSGGETIPVATKNTTTYPAGVDYYDLEVGVFRDYLHPDLPNGTRLYGYRNRGASGGMHLGGAIVAMKDTPVRLQFTCNLPTDHILPIDTTIAQGSTYNPYTGDDRAAIHLHGGLVPWPSDGGPFHWISTGGEEGASLPGTGWLPGPDGVTLTNDYFYPNHQSARFMWYHDHAIAITRNNAYAGVASGYFIIDANELAMANSGLPLPGDILVFQDKVFWDPALDPLYGNYVNPSVENGPQAGDLWYPYIYDPKIWKLVKAALPLPIPSCVAEMFGDTMLVNGTPYPYMNVGGMHRLRMLNACNARFLNLSFAVENPNNPGEPKISAGGLPLLAPVSVWQIGTEGGFLPAPVQLVNNGVALAPLLLAPAERADLIVDFSGAAGMKVILYNDAPAPFPGGSALFDFSTQTNNAKRGVGPNTRTILQFRVGTGSTFALPDLTGANPVLPTAPDPTNGGLMIDTVALAGGPFAGYNYLDPAAGGNTQELTLNEAFDSYGRLAQLVGNVNNAGGMFGSPYWDGPGEQVQYGTIQIWNVYNLTADTHPMHVHLFNAMILRRRPFKVNQFNGAPVWTGPGVGPDPNETGWKETFKMHPGTCTTLAVLVEDPFQLPNTGTGVYGSDSTTRTYTILDSLGTPRTASVPHSPRLLSSFGVSADEYVWHCHILEHEEHDMMHSLEAS